MFVLFIVVWTYYGISVTTQEFTTLDHCSNAAHQFRTSKELVEPLKERTIASVYCVAK
jgi:hypothetical protein